jgi:hypothetical protein
MSEQGGAGGKGDQDFTGTGRDFAKHSWLFAGGFLETGEAVLQCLHFRERERNASVDSPP